MALGYHLEPTYLIRPERNVVQRHDLSGKDIAAPSGEASRDLHLSSGDFVQAKEAPRSIQRGPFDPKHACGKVVEHNLGSPGVERRQRAPGLQQMRYPIEDPAPLGAGSP